MTLENKLHANLSKIIIIFILFVLIFKILLLLPINSDGLYSIKIYDNNDELIYETTNMYDSTYVEIEEINQYTIDAFTSIEDKFFYDHYGVNPTRTLKSFILNILNDEITAGGSTITQQLAKNMYLDSSKSYLRKLKETYLAFKLEAQYSKDEIMEMYLNTLYFGHNIYGIRDASQFYFSKHVSELDINESAMLAAIINGPEIYSPLNDLEKSLSRKNLVLGMMEENDKISQSDYTKYTSISPKIYGYTSLKYQSTLLYYKDGVLDELTSINLPTKISEISIFTGYDTTTNNYIDNILKNAKIDYETSIVLLNNSTHLYESVVGGNDYYISSYNRAINSNRHVGSTLKPFIYLNALEQGINADTMLSSEKTTFYVNGDSYTPSNYANQFENEKITMAYALAVSDNIYAIKMHLFLGQNLLYDTLTSMDCDVVDITPSLALGATEMPLTKLTNTYSTIANNGNYSEAKYISSIISNDKTIYTATNPSKEIFSDESNYIMIDLLENTFDTSLNQDLSVTGSSISHLLNTRFAAKSGSTDYDNYFVGFNPNITIAVWNGYDSNTEIKNSIFTKTLWKDIANKYMSNKTEIWFNVPNNLVESTSKVTEKSNDYFNFYKNDSRPKK